MRKPNKNTLVLSILFFGPLLFYLFLLTGTNNFAKLPRLTENIDDIEEFSSTPDSIKLENNISVLCFLGADLLNHKTNALNLNEKIYKHFYGFKGFQFVVVLPKGSEADAEQLKKELGATYNVDKWHFVFGDGAAVEKMFGSLKTSYMLDDQYYTPYAFIVDRELTLRGRDDEEAAEEGLLYGYNAESVATVHQEMVDDVKVVMAEYRLALKKNKREI
jgi:hypothetical protein